MWIPELDQSLLPVHLKQADYPIFTFLINGSYKEGLIVAAVIQLVSILKPKISGWSRQCSAVSIQLR